MPDLTTQPLDGPNNDQDGLKFESMIQHGHPVTVVRDTEGHIAYPNYVPPPVLSPNDAISPSPSEQIPPQARSGPKKSTSDPAQLESFVEKSEKRPGLSLDKKFVTEMPGRGARQSSTLPPELKRAGTNVSELQQALWNQYRDNDTSSSSSSSEDEGEPQSTGDATANRKPKARPKSSNDFRSFRLGNENYKTKGKISKKDGRLAISVKDTSNTGYLANALGAAVRKVVPLKPEDDTAPWEGKRPGASRLSSAATEVLDSRPCPPLNIVIMVIGSRGDAQPFLKIGQVLQEQYGHRVRIATHPAFRDFVEKDTGLEFFSVGGDPAELMAFMVKNPGMIPSLESVKAGDIGRRRAAMAEMFEGFWKACICATDDEKDTRNVKMMGDKAPFVADAIIANPPSFAHIHCAEALGIPLHLMFTFPYTPTQAFPHPLANIKKSNVDPGYTNFMSYPLVEMMVWQGLGDLVNDFREKTLGLDPVSTLWAPGATYRLHVPFTYMWSPGLVPKPEDWGVEIDISGFVFLDLASSFKPPSDLEKFLADSEEPPVYIGFGSIVVDDADHFTDMIFEAVKSAGVRALVSKGWGGLGCDNVPDYIYMLENTPHDWLFPKVSACIIHGGAGTTAIALKCGKPTMVVPFFGDQHFWGSMLERSKAGPAPVPYKHLSAEVLAEGIKYCLTDEARQAAKELAKDIELEGDGAENACNSFHQHLTLHGKHSMRCSILDDQVAVWRLKDSSLKLSAMAADAIVEKGMVPWRKLRLIRHNEWNDFEGPGEPVTGFAGSLVSTAGDIISGVGGIPYRLAKSSGERKERKAKRKERHEARAKAKQATQARARQRKALKDTEQNGTINKVSSKAEEGGVASDPAVRKENALETKDFASKNKKAPTQGTTEDAEAEDENFDTVSQADTEATAETTEENPAEDFVNHVGEGVSKSAQAIARAPVDLSLAVAQGFHNAPRLYGDDTVRRPTRVTGIHSGLKAARHEFVYGIYDGVTGLVRLPVRGARDGGGVKGFTKGVGMGITGFFLKDIAALAGPVGYTLKGIAKQVERGKQPIKLIRRGRIVQGQRELQALSDDERKKRVKDALAGWDVINSLWDAVEQRQKEKGGLRARLRSSKKQRGVVSTALENVEIAQQALDAVRRGETVESVVGKQRKSEEANANTRGRKSEDGGHKSSDKRRSHEKSRDPDDLLSKGKKKATVTEPIQEEETPAGQEAQTTEQEKKPVMNGKA